MQYSTLSDWVIVKVLLCSCPFFYTIQLFWGRNFSAVWTSFSEVRCGRPLLVEGASHAGKGGAPYQMELITSATSLNGLSLFLFRLLFSRTAFCSVWLLLGKVLLRSCLILFSLQLFWVRYFSAVLTSFFRVCVVDWYWSGNSIWDRTFLLSACLMWRYRWYF